MAECKEICPVCDHVRTEGEGLRCPNCQFPAAFLTRFAGERSRGTWEQAVRSARRDWIRRRTELLRAPGSFVLDWQSVAYLDTQRHLLTIFSSGEAQRRIQIQHIRQYSPGAHHTVFLRTDGTVEAQGNNDYGQCVVGDLRGIVWAAAAAQCTLAVDESGQVQVRGACPYRAEAERWREIRSLACGSYHAVGLRRDGQVCFAGGPLAPAVFRRAAPPMAVPVTAVAAASDCALMLHKDGTVTFAGREGDPRREAARWKRITAVAVESQYAVGLTEDGRVLLAGERHPMLDMGRAKAAEWSDMAAVACGGACIGGVTRTGELRLAGNIQGADALRAAWTMSE